SRQISVGGGRIHTGNAKKSTTASQSPKNTKRLMTSVIGLIRICRAPDLGRRNSPGAQKSHLLKQMPDMPRVAGERRALAKAKAARSLEIDLDRLQNAPRPR